jgi:hypothetical protein
MKTEAHIEEFLKFELTNNEKLKTPQSKKAKYVLVFLVL